MRQVFAPPGGLLLARLGAGLALLAALAVVAAAPGYRLGWWGLGAAFLALRTSVYAAGVAAVLSLAGIAIGRRQRLPLVPGLVGVVVAVAAAAGPLAMQRQARSVPLIHDVTTDPEDPPAFVAVLPLRQGAPNPPGYDGAAVARLQRAGYPDLAPRQLQVDREQAFAAALAVARDLGWRIVAAVPAEGRIEATAITRWWGFRDDVVLRLRPEGSGTRVDVRSKSRVGRSDLGANARRIRAFLDALTARLTSG